jgi:hypothetical protein
VGHFPHVESPMTNDPSSRYIPSNPDPRKNFAEMGETGTFGDIGPSYGLPVPQCRPIELAQTD